MSVIEATSPFDVRFVLGADGLLAVFNQAGILEAADVHVARRLGQLANEDDETVLLGAALAVRAPRLGHVFTDLATARTTATTEVLAAPDVLALPWPAEAAWADRLGASALVTTGEGPPDDRPLRLVGRRLYLDRLWRQEVDVARDLEDRAVQAPPPVADDVVRDGLQRLFTGEGADGQRRAAAAAVHRPLAVVAGGPGTGKTTTVARVVALLHEEASARGRIPPKLALAAPTGKAAARLQEAVHHEAGRMPIGDAVRRRLLDVEASTLHRLLGWRPGSRSRFRHDRNNRLPHDIVAVDETSMVSLSLMARLLEAVRRDARLILVGDPDQLVSVEAGAVLGDIVGSARQRNRTGPEATPAIGAGIVVLRHVYRYGSTIDALAAAIQRGDADSTISALRGGAEVRWIDGDPAEPTVRASLSAVSEVVVEAGRQLLEAAKVGDGRAALAALSEVRVLCAHRRGPHGATTWAAQVERWLAEAIDTYGAGGRWYVGRPLLVTENDYGLRLYNGDTGVIVQAGAGRVVAVFERGSQPVEFSPSRLGAVETVHAMTVHKAQGSQFTRVAVLLPPESSALLTRELLYTAVTRARRELIVVGPEASIRRAVERPIARASGLRERLWGIDQRIDQDENRGSTSSRS